MALSDHFADPPAAMRGSPCSIGTLLNGTLDDADKAFLEKILADRAWSQEIIWQRLRTAGHNVGRQSINRHRGRKCRCDQ